MKILGKQMNIPAFVAIATILVIAIGITFHLYWNVVTNPHINGLLGGLLTGLLVMLFQLYLSWYEYRNIKKFLSMGIKDVMPHRDSRDFYEVLIRNSKKRIYVMGVTANRMLDDFADMKATNREEAKVLLTAMSRGVKVQILLPKDQYLKDNLKATAGEVKTAFTAIQNKYPQFEFRYFDHDPAHSIFIVDNTCIVGPVFPDISSKDTPAIYMEDHSPFAAKYLDYYNTEWAKAQ
jgi:hypothetical protein